MTRVNSLFFLVLLALSSNVVFANSGIEAACADAANVMIVDDQIQIGRSGYNKSSRSEIRWTSRLGYEGYCLANQQGRLYEVKITRFPRISSPPSHYGSTITCSSRSYQREVCDLPSTGRVYLDQQLSNSRCIQGETWGVIGRVLWVEEGCSGRFRIDAQPAWEAYTLRCESTNNSRHECRVKANGIARLYKQVSRSTCDQGYSWGQNDNVIWVDKGCRAIFEIEPGGYGYSSGSAFNPQQAVGACRAEARQNRFVVVSSEVVKRNDSTVHVELEARRGNVAVNLDCHYNIYSRRARID